jgi:deoxyribodipyrimidine photo-lyase
MQSGTTGINALRIYNPAPIVDHLAAAREARQRLIAVRRQPESRAEARDIQQKMGRRRGARRSRKPPSPQTELEF